METQVQIIFDSKCAVHEEHKEVISVLVSVREMLDEVMIAQETEAPVDKREKQKDARDNLPL